MKQTLQESFAEADVLSFDSMTHNQTRCGDNIPHILFWLTDFLRRRAAASCLFEILVLKSKGFIDIKQKKAFGDIVITPTALL